MANDSQSHQIETGAGDGHRTVAVLASLMAGALIVLLGVLVGGLVAGRQACCNSPGGSTLTPLPTLAAPAPQPRAIIRGTLFGGATGPTVVAGAAVTVTGTYTDPSPGGSTITEGVPATTDAAGRFEATFRLLGAGLFTVSSNSASCALVAPLPNVTLPVSGSYEADLPITCGP